MKTLKWLMIVPAFFLLLCTSCASEEEAMDTIQETNLSYSKYSEYSEKPLVSILDLAQGKASISRSGDYILGLTKEDANYFNSLDSDGLLNLKTELMNKWGFESDEDIENVLDQVYDELCENLSAEELVKFNEFITEYIEMPRGINSIEALNVLQSSSDNPYFNDVCIYAAVGIDNFGRVLCDSLYSSRASASDCKKNFAIRIAITSVGTMAGMILPGPGWAVAAAAVCDAASAAADYANCLNRG